MQTILKQLYNKENLAEIEVESLQQLTQQYPYFGLAQYLLTKKLALQPDERYPDQFQKTLVYFHNPLWLQYQLSQQTAPVKHNQELGTILNDNHVVNDDDGLSHDMVETVVLHQESQHGTPEEMLDVQTQSTEVSSVERPPAVEPEPAADEATTAPQHERFSFQAYHTVDYFASQGIRLNQEVQSNDKLGKQLKSFTEWLKTMRRLPESVAEEVLDKISDVEVVQFAAESLEEKEVVTEAMAEVLLKQGKPARAKEVYNKLSLLHPHKSAYFAAKIEDLKHQ